MAQGDDYTGKGWSDGKEPVVNYVKGNLYVDDDKTYSSGDDPEGIGRITLYTDQELESGEYILEFGPETCGNNLTKVLGVPIAFQFTIQGKRTFDGAIRDAESLYDSAKIGTGSGDYRSQEKKDALKAGLDKAKALAENPGATDNEKELAAEELENAMKELVATRIVQVTVNRITGIDSAVSVGDSGTAKAELLTEPSEARYEKCTWLASENIQIDSRTGQWTALWTDENSFITAVSKWQQEQPQSIPGELDPDDAQQKAKAASKTMKLSVTSEGDGLSIGIPKGEQEESAKGRLQTTLEKSGKTDSDVAQLTGLKIFDRAGTTLQPEDFQYIREKMERLEELDLSGSNVREIPTGALAGMDHLKTVRLPDRLLKIEANAFEDCAALSDVEIPAGVTAIGEAAFSKCGGLAGKHLTINAVTPPQKSEGRDIFDETAIAGIRVPYGCSGEYKADPYWSQFDVKEDETNDILSLTVSKTGGLQEAAEAALKEESRAESQIDTLKIQTEDGIVLNYEKDIPYLQNHFLNATTIDLSQAALETNKLKSSTFKNRVNLKKIRLHEDTATVAGNSFDGCKNLSDIVLPKGLTKIGQSAFAGCEKLGNSIIINALSPPSYDGTIFPETIDTIIVPAGRKSAYEKAIGWSGYRIVSQVEVSLDADSAVMEVGTRRTLHAQVKVYNNNDDSVYWTSSNERVASVDRKKGEITAIKPGTATVTATTMEGGITVSCTVTVRAVAAPSAKAASAGYNKTKVTWTGISGAAGYEVYRSQSRNGAYTKIMTMSPSARSYTDTGRATGTTYYYKVRAYKVINGTRYLGDYSAAAAAKPVLSKPTKAKAKKGGSKKIKVSWKKVDGASGYKVYRSLKKSKGYKCVKTQKGAKSVNYTDSKLKKGKRYYYKMRAYRKVGKKTVYSSYSAVVSYRAK